MTKTQIKCPQCGRLTFYSPENPSRPFCSERCKLIDLGQWASEGYRIPTQPTEGYTEEDVDTVESQYKQDRDSEDDDL